MARHRSHRTRIAFAIAGVLILTFVLGVAAAGGVFVGRQLSSGPSSHEPEQSAGQQTIASPTAPPPSSPPQAPAGALADEFAALQSRLQARVGIAVAPAGNGDSPLRFGDWETGPAWSTIKFPLAIAALRAENPPYVTDAMRAAITESDNAAAESIWQGLGEPAVAAQKVEAVLRQTGDDTVVQSKKVRPEFTAFGQTDWPLDEQARFLSAAACDPQSQPILDLMGEIEPSQSWGIGTIAGTRFKGGWGPDPAGSYLVRQIGLLKRDTETVTVAVAAQPDSGSFDDGVAALGEVAKWLTEHLAELPAGRCGP